LLRELTADVSGISIPCRVAGAVLDTEPTVAVLGVYVPSRDRSIEKTDRKQRFIRSLIAAYDQLPADLARCAVVGGDYNVIARTHHPMHPGFLSFEFDLLDSLHTRGLVDVYERLSPGVQAHSWIGRTGDGYRYDYLHASEGIARLATSCGYVHETRDQRLTDHAAVTMTLQVHTNLLATSDPTAPEAKLVTLF
jgi:exodeoxyribonuclease III